MYNGAYNTPAKGYGATLNYATPTYSFSQTTYTPTISYHNSGYITPQREHYHTTETHAHAFIAKDFLNPNRPDTPQISQLGEVAEIIEETYEKITGTKLPEDIIMIICTQEQFQNIYESTGSHYTPGIMGFSYNKYGRGKSEIYIKEAQMDELLLTIGHEIGHVLSPTLHNQHDEEAKAHAFSLAWMNTIRDNNIGGLAPNITLNPANNGLHDVAFDFVKQLLYTGSTPLDIFKTLSTGLTSIIAGG